MFFMCNCIYYSLLWILMNTSCEHHFESLCEVLESCGFAEQQRESSAGILFASSIRAKVPKCKATKERTPYVFQRNHNFPTLHVKIQSGAGMMCSLESTISCNKCSCT
uniref:Putative secreted protein n=1 Tax=Rhipicephalus microplus TaxID=6941 RepID=A0A6G5A1T0_RHIMP